ncbi:hypothetical protein Y032_0002g949 [Ancylostoma ceylanicum]|uniref:Uncharacterized protein n=1 Tax=Ancylostoma ceylanicum TaxID=53326 RepID=A0A016W347_9BILA|nr:hypothetical protein Y032_0002g949 [Ancylostoma ceylanicum]
MVIHGKATITHLKVWTRPIKTAREPTLINMKMNRTNCELNSVCLDISCTNDPLSLSFCMWTPGDCRILCKRKKNLVFSCTPVRRRLKCCEREQTTAAIGYIPHRRIVVK